MPREERDDCFGDMRNHYCYYCSTRCPYTKPCVKETLKRDEQRVKGG